VRLSKGPSLVEKYKSRIHILPVYPVGQDRLNITRFDEDQTIRHYESNVLASNDQYAQLARKSENKYAKNVRRQCFY
jgi:hypothetical protein